MSRPGIVSLVDRLEDVLHVANAALARNDLSQVASTTHELLRYVLEFNRLTAERDWNQSLSPSIRDRLKGVQGQLAEHARALDIQIGALRRIIRTLTDAERARATDTTYVPLRNRKVS
jgi:hypothetical protein